MNPKILEIDGWMAESELQWLYRTAQRIPDGSLIVEIGAWKGRSSAALYDGAGNNKTVVSIDTWQGQPDLRDSDHAEVKSADMFAVYLANMIRLDFCPRLKRAYTDGLMGPQCIIGDSVETAQQFEDCSIDWLFIDGDHVRTGEDIDAYLPKMKLDGLMTGHDYFCFYETVQQEIHKRFYIHELHHSIWVRYMGASKPAWS